MKVTPIYRKNLEAVAAGKRFVINQGGTSSSKTYSVLQNIISLCHIKSNLIISIVAETYPHLKRGAMRDFFHILMNDGIYNESDHNRSDSSYRIGSNLIEFFSGDKAERMKGARRDILFVNEAYGIKYDIFDQLEIRTNWFVLIDFNPVAEFWVHDELMAKNPDECGYIHSTYRDNPFLSARIVESILRHRNSPYWWKVYGEGLTGKLEGAIFQNWHYGEFDDHLPFSFGLDFGFNDPDAMVKVAIDQRRKIMYWDQRLYQSGNTPGQLGILIGQSARRNDLITADCADARMIAELKQKGFNIRPVNKTKWTVSEALRLMQDYEHVITEDSTDLAKEFKNYLWSDKRAGIPIDGFDHLIDCGRYRFMETVTNANRGRAKWHT
jgi:phage terminase large subunit